MKNYLIYMCLTIAVVVSIMTKGSIFDKKTEEISLLPHVDKANILVPTANGSLNEEAPIPSQCYTKTEGINNPCYTCHQSYQPQPYTEARANLRNDGANQGLYNFSDEGEINSWKNLFVNRKPWIAKISDKQITEYVDQDNYSKLSTRLRALDWQGFIPDLKNYHLGAKAFNHNGIAKDGSAWVAFNYKPFPGTFWPTNGATDDVLIRLPKAFRELNGEFDQEVYLTNLSLVEMSIKAIAQMDIYAANELRINHDLNQDGKLTPSVASVKKRDNFIGDAKHLKIPHQQYPVGTEIMHSVRYIGAKDNGEIYIPQRMKELRYMKKTQHLSEADIDSAYRRERKEKLDEQLPHYTKIKDNGFNNKFGWLIQGFIEDYAGELRPQSHEETFYCMGCHSAIGTTIDQTFSLPRKVTGKAGWGYVNLKGMKDVPSKGQSEGEILQYLKVNGGGNEFRENDEMLSKWYGLDGLVNEEKVKSADVYELLMPSKKRALQLNKAYTQIVRSQSFIHGRDVNITPAKNVHKKIDESITPLKEEFRIDDWDIRLDWSNK
ncbi:hypothetical protein AADZ91_02860 [Colwelliaceae bacterium 6441]